MKRLEIRIRPGGRMANQLLQYLAAVNLAELLGGARITGYSIPDFNLVGGPVRQRRRLLPRISSHRYDPEWLRDRVATGAIPGVEITWIPSVLALLPNPDKAARLLQPADPRFTPIAEDELLIHIRLEDTIGRKPNPFYGPLPLGWYHHLVQQTGLAPVFIGQMGQDPYSTALRQAFPQARFLPPDTPLHDFQTLRHAPNVALAISTFSWLAAWLNPHATIHYPVQGLLNPTLSTYPRFFDPSDPRFQLALFAPRHWTATPDEIAALIHDTTLPEPLAPDAAAALLARSDALAAPILQAWREDFADDLRPVTRLRHLLRRHRGRKGPRVRQAERDHEGRAPSAPR